MGIKALTPEHSILLTRDTIRTVPFAKVYDVKCLKNQNCNYYVNPYEAKNSLKVSDVSYFRFKI